MTEAVLQLGEAWWSRLAPVALELAALCVLALVLDALLWRRLRPGFRALVLSVALVRAALPFHLSVEVKAERAPAAVEAPGAAVDTSPLPLTELVSSAPTSGQAPPAPAALAKAAPVRAVDPPADAAIGWRGAIGLLWALGAAAGLVSLAVAEVRTRRMIRGLDPADGAVQGSLDALAARAGVRAPVALSAPGVLGAAVHGLLRPVLLVSPETAALPSPSLRAVLAHELGHVRARDPLRLLALALLQRIWWPHVPVHAVARRLRAAIEEARDAGAVALVHADPAGPAPARAYAQLLIDLTSTPRPRAAGDLTPLHGSLPFLRQDRRDLERRITMIMSQRPPRRSLAALLAAASMALGSAYAWTEVERSYVPAAPSSDAAAVAPETPGLIQEQHTVHCERQGPPPAWQVDLLGKLGKRLPRFAVDDQTASEALGALAEAHGLPVGRVEGGNPIEPMARSFVLEDVTVEEAFSLLVRLEGMHWSMARGSLWVGPWDDIPRHVELRMYGLAKVLEATELDTDRIVDMVRSSSPTGTYDWDLRGMQLDVMGELLVVHATDRMHTYLHRILDGIAEQEVRITGPEGPWVARLDAALDGPFEAAEREFGSGAEALDHLRATSGLPILLDMPVHGDVMDLRGRTTLQGATLREALERLVRDGDFARAAPLDGAIWISESPSTELWIHRVPDAVFDTDDPESFLGGLEGLIRESVDPDFWDADVSAFIEADGSYVMCGQSRHNQRGVAAVLGQVERALAATSGSR